MKRHRLPALYRKRQTMREAHARMTDPDEIRAQQKRLDAITELIVIARRLEGE